MSAEFKRTKKTHWFEVLSIASIIGLTLWFYIWTVWPEPSIQKTIGGDNSYYNFLIRGFLKGRLAMDIPADPFLATLKNPYDLAQRAGHGLHDASYYKGNYYLYFGVTPALVLFLPFRLLTGLHLSEGAASVFFAGLGLLGMFSLLMAIRLRYFAKSPSWVFVGALLGLGLANMMPALLRRASFWEVPITAGHACAIIGLAAIYRAVHSSSRSFWLAVGSLSLGAAVGARPVYLLGCAALLVPLLFWSRLDHLRRRPWLTAILAAVGPAALVGFGLAMYNWARFDSPFQFGQNYQMSADGVNPVFFSLSYLWYGVKLYWLEPAGWSPFFPFVTVISPPPAPIGQLGVENPYGILSNIPYVVLICGLWCLVGRASSMRKEVRRLAIWIVSALVLTGATMITVMSFGGITNRYMVDFLPVIILLASCGWLAVTSLPWFAGLRGLILGFFAVGLLLYSAFFNIMVSMQHNRLLRVNHPEAYARVAHLANYVSFIYDRWAGIHYGPIEMRVVFPTGVAGHIQPLVVTGRTFLSDYLFVHYLSNDKLRFGYEHTSYGGSTGDAVKVVPGQIYTLVIDFGSLYPPAAHPYFSNMPIAQARMRQRSIRVTLDGVEVLHKYAELYDAVSRLPDIGQSADRVAFKEPFTGEIKGWRVLPEAAPVIRADQFGPLLITAQFPAFTGVRSEPLVSSGEKGKGDLLYVKYLAADSVVFGYDHWGVGEFETPPLSVNPLSAQLIGVDYGALYEPGLGKGRNRIIVRLNGQVVVNHGAAFHECLPNTVQVGANLIGASTADPVFTGVILQQEREKPVQINEFGPISIKAKLPVFNGVKSEPIVSSGESGKGDLIYVKYLDANTIVFGYDHWGVGGFETQPLHIDGAAVQIIGVDYGALYPRGTSQAHDRVVLRLNGQVVADKAAQYHICEPDTVVVGANLIGASTSSSAFSGVVIGHEREIAPSVP
ncbi:MAG: hypothetical protein WCG63_03955 [Opitutaceae bacterium]